MKRSVYKLATEEDGKTRLSTFDVDMRDIAVGTGLQVGTIEDGAGVGLLCFPAGFKRDWHNSEARTWIFVMSGECTIEAFDEGAVTLKPGDVMYFDDLVGGGHRTAVPEIADVWSATAGLAVG